MEVFHRGPLIVVKEEEEEEEEEVNWKYSRAYYITCCTIISWTKTLKQELCILGDETTDLIKFIDGGITGNFL